MKRIIAAETFRVVNKIFGLWRFFMKLALWGFGVFAAMTVISGYISNRTAEATHIALTPAAYWLGFFLVYRVTDYLFLAVLRRLAARAQR